MLCIAGSDSSAGAGIQADIKTCAWFGVHATTAITAITCQTFSKIHSIDLLSPIIIRRQIESAAEAMRPDSVKIGMLGSAEIVEMVADTLKMLGLTSNIVCDPVMAATSGGSLCNSRQEMVSALEELIFPMCTLVTPNIPEAEAFLKRSIINEQEDAESLLYKWACQAVVLKGGHGSNPEICKDILCLQDRSESFSHERISCSNTHGTGCCFSSAVASLLALGKSVCESVYIAGKFMEKIIRQSTADYYSSEGGSLSLFRKKVLEL